MQPEFEDDFLTPDAVPAKFTSRRDNGRKRPRGYADWRPQAKTTALLDAVDVVLAEYEDHLPLTVRQIFYRLVGAHGHEKTEAAYDRLREHLVRARRARRIDFNSIRDDGVLTYSPEWYSSPEHFWDRTGQQIRRYRRDRQEGQGQRLEVWCEAAGMAPQLARVASDYSIPVFSSGGFLSLTAVRQIANRALDEVRPLVLLQVGDHDPSGRAIFEAVAADAAAFVQEDRVIGTQRVEAIRLALTGEQVATHNLETTPAKKTDSRTTRWSGGTCQLEALAPDQLATIVRTEIESHLNFDRFNHQVDEEVVDRRALLRALPAGEAS